MFFRRKSPENTNNNAEQTPSGSGAETEYPAFDPETTKRRIAEYKAAHPNAVEDIKKAEAMAYAGDPYRTDATKSQQHAKEFLGFAKDSKDEGKNDEAQMLVGVARSFYESTQEINRIADVIEEEAGRKHDYEQNPDQAMKDAVTEYFKDEQSAPPRSRFKPFGK